MRMSRLLIGKATTSNNLEIQRIVSTHQDQDFQFKCKASFTLWCRDMQDTVTEVQTFINSCLRRILKVHWPDKINNTSLWEKTQQIPAEREMGRRWGWIGHTLRKPVASTTRQALFWNPQGKRRRSRQRNTWRRDLLEDTNSRSWASPGTMTKLCQT